MALSPIQIFQQQQNPLAQILAGGNQAVTGIFDRAIQIGRDMSNKRLQQEQDMMAMRKFETSLAERRAENLQQNNEDAMRFARSAFESDRKFGVDQAQQTFQNERVNAQDLFGNRMEEGRLAVSQGGLQLNRDQEKANQGRLKSEATRLETEREEVKSLYPPTPPELQGPTKGGKLSALTPTISQEQAAGRRVAIERALSRKDISMSDAQKLGEEDARLQQMYPETGRTGSPFAEQDQEMQRKTFQDSQAAKADKVMEEKVLGNTTAFMPQMAVMQRRAADATKYNMPEKNPTGDELVEAKIYDKDRYVSEKASAGRMTLPEYLKKGPQDEASKKAREELWNYVNTGATSAGAPTAGKTQGDVTLDKYLGD